MYVHNKYIKSVRSAANDSARGIPLVFPLAALVIGENSGGKRSSLPPCCRYSAFRLFILNVLWALRDDEI